jgi:hypothetical protein
MTWQYVAGFFDGEGNINCEVRKGTSHRKFELKWYQTTREVLDAIGVFLAEEGIKSNVFEFRAGVRKVRCYCLSVASCADVYRALDSMYPYMVVKRTKAEEIMEVIEHRVVEAQAGRLTHHSALRALRPLINGTLTIPVGSVGSGS